MRAFRIHHIDCSKKEKTNNVCARRTEIHPLIERYRYTHLKFIQDLELLFRHCQMLIEETEDPNIKNMCNCTIELLERHLRDFRNMTPKVLRNTELIKVLSTGNDFDK